MEEYTIEERIEYISDKIEFLVEREPNILSVIERMVNGLIVVNEEVINNSDKMCILGDLRLIKNEKQISFIKTFTHIQCMEEFKNKKN